MLVSAVQHESGNMYTYILSLLSLPPTTPHPIPLGHHGAPSWAPVLYSSFPLAIYLTRCSSEYISMLLSRFFPILDYPYSIIPWNAILFNPLLPTVSTSQDKILNLYYSRIPFL